MTKHTVRLFTGRYTCILSIYMLICMYAQSVMSVLSPYLLQNGLTELAAGAATAAFSYAAICFRPFAVGVIARFPVKRLLSGCLLALAMLAFALVRVRSMVIVLTARILSGVAVCLGSIVCGVLIEQTVPRERFYEGMGYYGIGVTAMSFIGPALGRMAASTIGYPAWFCVLTGVMLCLAAWASFVPLEYGTPGTGSNSKPWFESKAFPMSFVLCLIILAHSVTTSFLPVFANHYGVRSLTSFYFIAGAGMVSIRFYCSIRRIEKCGGCIVRIAFLGISASLAAILLIPASYAAMCLIALVYGLSLGVAQPTVIARALEMCPAERKSAATVTYYIAIDIGYAVGNLLWGAIAQGFGYRSGFILAAMLGLVGLLSYIMIERKTEFEG